MNYFCNPKIIDYDVKLLQKLRQSTENQPKIWNTKEITTFRPAHSNRQLTSTSSSGITQEPALKSRQNAMLNTWAMHSHFCCVWGSHYTQIERTSIDRLTFNQMQSNFNQILVILYFYAKFIQ